MSPTTLANAFSKDSSEIAVIVPGSPALQVSYQKLSADVKAFQQQLANGKSDAPTIRPSKSVLKMFTAIEDVFLSLLVDSGGSQLSALEC